MVLCHALTRMQLDCHVDLSKSLSNTANDSRRGAIDLVVELQTFIKQVNIEAGSGGFSQSHLAKETKLFYGSVINIRPIKGILDPGSAVISNVWTTIAVTET